jgi:DNA repair protein RecN (Recombination protein N)
LLQNLSIKNYALIDRLEVRFGPGLNIITGETGAGKSIIIDALGLILGERADPAAVRQGSDRAVVEGIFGLSDNRNLERLLRENDIEAGEELILRREVNAKGQGRAFINDSPATLALLKATGELLVDLHGQHDHQSLLRVATHQTLLDEYGRLGGLAGEYAAAF